MSKSCRDKLTREFAVESALPCLNLVVVVTSPSGILTIWGDKMSRRDDEEFHQTLDPELPRGS